MTPILTHSGPLRATALDYLDRERARLSGFNARIWSYAEPAWREYKSARAYVDLLRAEGWSVEEGSGGMPTAFAARWEQGAGGALVAGFSEYDAVPGNSQQVVPYPAPREGLPFKLNQDRPQHIPLQRHRMANPLGMLLCGWPAYKAGSRQSGGLDA